MSILSECSKGWQPCRDAFLDQYAGAHDRRSALRAWAKSQGLPESVGDQLDACLGGDSKQCARAAATIAALAACDAATGGACPPCCGAIVGPVIAALWGTIGPTLEAVAEGATALAQVGLEWIGVKDTPTIDADIYQPMRKRAQAAWSTMRNAYLAKFPQGAGILDEELARAIGGTITFRSAWWYPTHYGNMILHAGSDPWKATWTFSWKTAWERDDAHREAARALAIGYQMRLQKGAEAIARAVGRQTETQTWTSLRATLARVQNQRRARVVSVVTLATGCGTLAIAAWYLTRR